MAPITRLLPRRISQKLAERATRRRSNTTAGAEGWAAARDPLRDGKQHNQDEKPHNFKGTSPAVVRDEEVDEDGRYRAAHSKPQVGIAHGAPARRAKPACDEHLVRDGSGEDVAKNFRDGKQVILPQVRHPSHQDGRTADKYQPEANDGARASAVDQGSEVSHKRGDNHETQQHTCGHLAARESQVSHQFRIEDGQAVKDDSDTKKEVQERRGNNPPAIEDAHELSLLSIKSISRKAPRHSRALAAVASKFCFNIRPVVAAPLSHFPNAHAALPSECCAKV